MILYPARKTRAAKSVTYVRAMHSWDSTAPPLGLGSLSTRVFETRTATGSELFSLLTCPHTATFKMLCIFSPLEMNSIKIWETIRSKNANCSLLDAVRVSKTRVLKLPISLYGQTDIRSYADVITKFSRLDGLPIFLTHGALLARFARQSSAKKSVSQY